MRYYKKKNQLEDLCFIEKYGAITYNIKTKTKLQLVYPLVNLAFRLSLVILLLRDNTTAQLFFYRIFFLLYFIYVGSTKAFISPKSYTIEMVHLTFLLNHNLLMPIYTDFVPDHKARYFMGWVSIFLIGA